VTGARRAATAALLLVLGLAALPTGGAGASKPPTRATGIWVSPAQLQRLPMRGAAWEALKHEADRHIYHPRIRSQNSDSDMRVLAAALVYARTGQTHYRAKALRGIMEAIGSERGGRTLALARNLLGYVIAADLIDLKHLDRAEAQRFARWLSYVRREPLEPKDSPTLIDTHELRPNNWGTMAGASRIAADAYLGDRADLARAAAVFKGWLGDRSAYSGFVYGLDKSWQADPAAPVGIDPAGTTKEGESIDGALPDDMRRGCPAQFPPCPTGYPWEALQGAVMQAELLYRQGYDAWNWEHKALLRAVRFLMGLSHRYPDAGTWGAIGDDKWIPWIINARFRVHLPTQSPTHPGKNAGFTDWIYQRPCTVGCRTPRVKAPPITPVTDPPRPNVPPPQPLVTPLRAGVAAAAMVLVFALGLAVRLHRAR
jgi:hypothetical protein